MCFCDTFTKLRSLYKRDTMHIHKLPTLLISKKLSTERQAKKLSNNNNNNNNNEVEIPVWA